MSRIDKVCLRCGITHRKRGIYCSSSCANTRPASDQTNMKRSLALAEYHKNRSEASDEAVWKMRGGSEDDLLIPVSSIEEAPGLEANQFVSDGAIWEVVREEP